MVLDLFSNFVLVDEREFCWLFHLSAKGFLLGSNGNDQRETLFTTAESHAQLAQYYVFCVTFNEVHSDELGHFYVVCRI